MEPLPNQAYDFQDEYALVPASEIERRIQVFQEGLTREGLGGALLVQRIDVFYLTGTAQEGWLWVPAQGEPRLMIKRDLSRARAESPLKDIEGLASPAELPGRLPKRPGRIGLELDVLPAGMYLNLVEQFSGVEFGDVSSWIRRVRMIKSDYELGWMRQAAALGDDAFAWLGGRLREGMRQVEIEATAAWFLRSQGHLGRVAMRGFNQDCFWGHVLTGPDLALSGAAPGPTTGQGLWPVRPEGAGWRVTARGEPISVDLVSIVGGYMVDQARLYGLGPLPDEVLKAQETVLAVQEMIQDRAGPGVPAADLDAAARDLVRRAGFDQGFMGWPDGAPFVAHGVGLELDEWPIIGRGSAQVLAPGMTFALEPKIVLPEVGMGGVENTWLVTEGGLARLTVFPDDPVIL